MKKKLFVKCLPISMLATLLVCACDTEEDYVDIYGSGSPLAENVMLCEGFEYEYNNDGLVTKITSIETEEDAEGNVTTTVDEVADISYPQSDRAVMLFQDLVPRTYVFAFGENHFANRVIEIEPDGSSYLYKVTYDSEGHVTRLQLPEEELKLEWTNGNMTKVIEKNEYDAYTELTYGDKTDFELYGMSPFLIGVHLGPFMTNIEWWFDGGLRFALYLGFLGKPCVNLPASLVSYDNRNSIPEEGHFEYWSFTDDEGGLDGTWSYQRDY